jgi:hypothetical protein
MATEEMTLRQYAKLNHTSWKKELTRMYREGNFAGASLQELMAEGPDAIHGPVEVGSQFLSQTASKMHIRARTLAHVQAQTGKPIMELRESLGPALQSAKGTSPDAAFRAYWNSETASRPHSVPRSSRSSSIPSSAPTAAPSPASSFRQRMVSNAAKVAQDWAANEASKPVDAIESQALEMGISPAALRMVSDATHRPASEFISTGAAQARYPNLDKNAAFVRFWKEGLTKKAEFDAKKKAGSMSEKEEMELKNELGPWLL